MFILLSGLNGQGVLARLAATDTPAPSDVQLKPAYATHSDLPCP